MSAMLDAALEYAAFKWRIVPQRPGRMKKPYIARWPELATCDPDVIREWLRRWPNANIAALVPVWCVVLDFDPRTFTAGFASLLRGREWPVTATVISGRGDGGFHAYFRLCKGDKLTGRDLPKGIDLLVGTHLVTLPPSIHYTGGIYTWQEPVPQPALMPDWLRWKCLDTPAPSSRRSPWVKGAGDSVADEFNATTTWASILEPHGWTLRRGDGDADGSEWRAPGVGHDSSASVRHGCLFNYDTTTPFDVTLPGEPHGYTRFRAWALLDHGGDNAAAFRALVRGAS